MGNGIVTMQWSDVRIVCMLPPECKPIGVHITTDGNLEIQIEHYTLPDLDPIPHVQPRASLLPGAMQWNGWNIIDAVTKDQLKEGD